MVFCSGLPRCGTDLLSDWIDMLRSEMPIEHITLSTVIAKPPAPVRIQPVMKDDYGRRSHSALAVVADGKVYAFPSGVSRPEVAEWLMRHGYGLGASGEWRRAPWHWERQ